MYKTISKFGKRAIFITKKKIRFDNAELMVKISSNSFVVDKY